MPHASLFATILLLGVAGSWVSRDVSITGINGLQRCSCDLHQEGVETTESFPEDPVSGCNVGELQSLGVAG